MHTCPDCGQACCCNGDIDDLHWGDESDEAMGCDHFMQCEQEDDDWEPEEEQE